MSKITNAVVRMYRLGTGDCFIIKFLAGNTEKFTMMIDGGTWSGSKAHLEPYVNHLKAYVNNHIDLLVITHEHKDHVHLFDVCGDLFTTNFTVDKIWMAWTEKPTTKVKQWQKDHGDKKKALAIAANKMQMAMADPAYIKQMNSEYNGLSMMGARKQFADIVNNFNDLQNQPLGVGKVYVGGLAGMETVKKTIAKHNIEYYSPGDVIENIPKLDGIRFCVLGPPLTWEEVKVETGGAGESYAHNKELSDNDAFAVAILAADGGASNAALPFDAGYALENEDDPHWVEYKTKEDWRKIDNDWLTAAGALALRINSITNNLSLALAIEFEGSGRVMLFPGDAEYGSWKSWHGINWSLTPRNGKSNYTEDLLSRTVFYKVAHHLSHHGTAEKLGMEMMTDPDLVSMATLDYDVISTNWKNTMPNRALLKALVKQTKGRLMIMNDKPLFYDLDDTVPLGEKIKKEKKNLSVSETKEFNDAYEEDALYLQFKVKGN